MKIAILADSHDNVPNMEKALGWINQRGISLIIHCGDLCAPSILTKVILPKFSGQLHFVHGNVGDSELLEKLAKDLKNVKIYSQVGEIELDGKKIAFTHQPEKGKELAQSGKYDLVFYGHTHKPWEEKVGNCRLVNPGTLAGMFYKATFAIYDPETDKLELKILEKL
ncbi:MAG: metallophosphoesterase family protein [Patescibacteria group bacterium]